MQAKQFSQRQQAFDRQVAVHERPANLRRRVFVFPPVDDRLVESRCDITATRYASPNS